MKKPKKIKRMSRKQLLAQIELHSSQPHSKYFRHLCNNLVVRDFPQEVRRASRQQIKDLQEFSRKVNAKHF